MVIIFWILEKIIASHPGDYNRIQNDNITEIQNINTKMHAKETDLKHDQKPLPNISKHDGKLTSFIHELNQIIKQQKSYLNNCSNTMEKILSLGLVLDEWVDNLTNYFDLMNKKNNLNFSLIKYSENFERLQFYKIHIYINSLLEKYKSVDVVNNLAYDKELFFINTFKPINSFTDMTSARKNCKQFLENNNISSCFECSYFNPFPHYSFINVQKFFELAHNKIEQFSSLKHPWYYSPDKKITLFSGLYEYKIFMDDDYSVLNLHLLLLSGNTLKSCELLKKLHGSKKLLKKSCETNSNNSDSTNNDLNYLINHVQNFASEKYLELLKDTSIICNFYHSLSTYIINIQLVKIDNFKYELLQACFDLNLEKQHILINILTEENQKYNISVLDESVSSTINTKHEFDGNINHFEDNNNKRFKYDEDLYNEIGIN